MIENAENLENFLYVTDVDEIEKIFANARKVSSRRLLPAWLFSENENLQFRGMFCPWLSPADIKPKESIWRLDATSMKRTNNVGGVEDGFMKSMMVVDVCVQGEHWEERKRLKYWLRNMKNIFVHRNIQTQLILYSGLCLLEREPGYFDEETPSNFFLDCMTLDDALQSVALVLKNPIKLRALVVRESACRSLYASLMVDVPGQSFSSLVKDMYFFFDLPLSGICLSPFFPVAKTRWEYFESACSLTLLKVISWIRLVRPDWKIFIGPALFRLSSQDIENELCSLGVDYLLLPESFESV